MTGAPVRLPANMMLDTCARLAIALPGLLAARGGIMCIDASGVRRFDSAAIALLLQAQRLARQAGGACEVLGLPSALLDLARLYGVDVLLATSSSLSDTDGDALLPAAMGQRNG